jgi:hypothetical protein
MLERRKQRFLRQILGQRNIAQHPRKAGDQPRLLDPPDRQDRAIDVSGRHGRRLRLVNACLKGRQTREARTSLPSPA